MTERCCYAPLIASNLIESYTLCELHESHFRHSSGNFRTEKIHLANRLYRSCDFSRLKISIFINPEYCTADAVVRGGKQYFCLAYRILRLTYYDLFICFACCCCCASTIEPSYQEFYRFLIGISCCIKFKMQKRKSIVFQNVKSYKYRALRGSDLLVPFVLVTSSHIKNNKRSTVFKRKNTIK